MAHSIKTQKEEIAAEKKATVKEEAKLKETEREASRTLEENYSLRTQNDEAIRIVQKIRDRISHKYDMYEQEIERLFTHKQAVKERVLNELKLTYDLPVVDYPQKATKTKAAHEYTNKLTSNEYQIDCLKQIVVNEKNRVDQRLDIIREKTKMLKQLISLDD